MKTSNIMLIAAGVAAFAFWTKKSFAASATQNTKGTTRDATAGVSPINSSAVAKLSDARSISRTPTIRLAVDPVTGARLLPIAFGLPGASAFQNPKARTDAGNTYRPSNAAAATAPLRPDYSFNYRSTVAPTATSLR